MQLTTATNSPAVNGAEDIFLISDKHHDICEEILEKIRFDLRREKTNTTKKILVVSMPRSGSSFLAEFLAQFPGFFYHFEPLHLFNDQQSDVDNKSAENLIRALFNCEFGHNSKLQQIYYNHFLNHKVKGFLERNFRLFDKCSALTINPNSICYSPILNMKACKLHPNSIIKLVRPQLIDLASLLKDEKDLKIVGLFRDPRAVKISHYKTFQDNYTSTETFCKRYKHLWDDIQRLAQMYPERVMSADYESLALDPWTKAKEMLTFLDLRWTQRARNYLAKHTSGSSNNNAFGTKRESKEKANQWRNEAAKDWTISELVKSIESNSLCISLLHDTNFFKD